MKYALIAILDTWLSMLALLSIVWGPILYQEAGANRWLVLLLWGLVICGSNFAGYMRGYYAGREV